LQQLPGSVGGAIPGHDLKAATSMTRTTTPVTET
jgi:hypothetical protein